MAQEPKVTSLMSKDLTENPGRVFHRRRQVSPVVKYLTHRFFDGYYHLLDGYVAVGENAKLKRLLAETMLDNAMLKAFFVVHDDAFAAEQDVQPPITESGPIAIASCCPMDTRRCCCTQSSISAA
jgi:hypothetical protein